MRFGMILLGMIFIFSPDISMIDLLPDAVGWLLMVFGLSPLADLEFRADEAKKLALRMVFLSLAKHFISLYTFRFTLTDNLLATFSVAILELITVLPFSKDFIKSLEYSSMRLSAPINSDYLNTTKWYLYVFFVLKNVFMVFPTTLALFESSTTGEFRENTWFIDFNALSRVFTVFVFFFSVIVFALMLFHFIPFFSKIRKNEAYISALTLMREEEVLSSASRMIKKHTAFVLAFLTFSSVFFFDFYIDGNDALPTFIGFIGIFIASLFAKIKMKEKTLPLVVTSALGGIASSLSYFYKYYHLKEKGFVIDLNFSKFTYSLPLALIALVFSALGVILLISFVDKMGERYTREKVGDSTLLLKLGGVVLSVFGFFLYTYPDLNTTFTFPSLIFGGIYLSLLINYILKTGKQIRHDNKD